MKKVLVAGGSGFLGSNFIKYIKKIYPDYSIINLDKINSDYNYENLRYIEGDISDRNFILNLFEKEEFDIVINCASAKIYNKDTNDKSIFTITNIIGTQNLLDASREYGVKIYHQVPTNEVYKKLENTEIPNYVASKLAADKLVIAYEKEYGLRASISRYNETCDIDDYCNKIDSIIHNYDHCEIYDI